MSMKNSFAALGCGVLACLVGASLPAVVHAQQQQAAVEPAPAVLATEDLEILVARIALYPDDLVAAIVSAALQPLQIVQAARFLDKLKKDPGLKPDPTWDGSVISLLNYPEIVKMMSDDLDWTEALGAAVVSQQTELLAAIQQLRDKAVASGLLKSSDKAVVSKEEGEVIIKSPTPEVIYVPQYDPQVLIEPAYVAAAPLAYYPTPYPSYYYPGAAFWAGAVTGAVWAGAVDWRWGNSWGGDVDIDINNVNINNVDRNKIEQNLRSNNRNQLNNQTRSNTLKQGLSTPKVQGRDVRKDVQSGLKKQQPAGQKKAQAPAGQQKKASTAQQRQKSPQKQMAKQPDRRQSKPSVVGDYGQGKSAKQASNRGRQTTKSMQRQPRQMPSGNRGRRR